MIITNKHGVPEPLVTLAKKQYYNKGKSDFTATEVMAPPKIKRLREQYDDLIEVDVTDMMWSMFGSALHVVMERGETDGWLKEERVFTEIDGVTLSGQIDLQQETPEGIIIHDYKVTKAWAVMKNKEEWHQQLNFYKWLVETVKKKKVVGLKICAFVRDFNKFDTREGYPPSEITVLDVPVWDSVKTEVYIRERLNAHRDAKVAADLGYELPDCTDEERWQSETVYAVKREGRKTAIKLFKSIDEANELAVKEKGYVETRQGEPVRCTGNYCYVAPWCKQYQESIEHP